jgi:plastocyanin
MQGTYIEWSRAAAVAGCVALAGCGGGSGGGGNSGPTAPSSPTVMTITVLRDNGTQSFSPNPASAGGQVVVFRNADSVVHRVRLNDLSVDTGDIAPGATSRQVQIPADGANYHCSLHPTMIGSIGAASGAPPPPCTIYCGGDD